MRRSHFPYQVVDWENVCATAISSSSSSARSRRPDRVRFEPRHARLGEVWLPHEAGGQWHATAHQVRLLPLPLLGVLHGSPLLLMDWLQRRWAQGQLRAVLWSSSTAAPSPRWLQVLFLVAVMCLESGTPIFFLAPPHSAVWRLKELDGLLASGQLWETPIALHQRDQGIGLEASRSQCSPCRASWPGAACDASLGRCQSGCLSASSSWLGAWRFG